MDNGPKFEFYKTVYSIRGLTSNSLSEDMDDPSSELTKLVKLKESILNRMDDLIKLKARQVYPS